MMGCELERYGLQRDRSSVRDTGRSINRVGVGLGWVGLDLVRS